ncbi:hypothetical protein [Paenibacillus humicus]|uniref:hypothetical protein n=1 Tax=Paenibacillus humicus TaxID=412861 RepID=UPI000FDBA62F|nr:hypothetical protein [Paenibacillus humicus]
MKLTMRELMNWAEKHNVDLDAEIQIGVEFSGAPSYNFNLQFECRPTLQPEPTFWITKESVVELMHNRMLG